ncbi:MAG: hypothetical protein B7Z01_14100 [Brevundimonas subvibrioides]|uniref:GNAT family N-acetyltransferase n=1 Tax=Brevundimonas subvibrioides TaxID=74313 RepID=A0A258FE35_9CAUL|nr:MAG: hypothetical protein B7Z01_14100 [Brevundimonas subvibrioides]
MLAVRSAKTSDLEALIDLNAVVQSLHATLEPAQFLTQADRDGVAALFSATLEKEPDAILVAEGRSSVRGGVSVDARRRV